MRRFLVRATLLALAPAALAACANPTYAPRADYSPPPPIQPKYAIQSQPAPSAATPTPTPTPTVTAPAALARPQPSPAVETAELPPAASTAPEVPGSPPTESAPAPASVTPTPAPAPAQPSPQAQYVPPPPTRRAVVREEPGHVIAGGRVVAATGMFRDYAVQKHDHVDAIARDLGTTRKIVVDANHLKAPFTLQPGQHLKVPVARAYVAQSGDTLAQVARRFGLGADELALLNDLSERSRLRAGERLALPADFHDHGATRSKPTYVTEYVEEPPRQTPYRAGPARIATTVPPSTTSKPSPSPPYAPPRTSTSPAQAYAPPATHPYAPPPVRPTVQAYVPARPTVQAYEPPPPRVSSASETTESLPADVAALGRGRFIWPVRGEIISPFGVKGLGRRNDGVDIRARQGTVILAAAGGNVVYAGDQVPGFGNLVLVKHSDGWVTAYAHLDKISVQMRQNINQGQEIGQVGETGGAAEPELHFEVRYAATPTDRAKPVDPMVVLPR